MVEMTALEYLKEKRRMTESCNIYCGDCPLSIQNNKKMVSCKDLERGFPEEAISAVQEWAEKHHVKTMLEDFFEKHPNAPIKAEGDPICCIMLLGYRTSNEGCYGNNCFECWNRPLEE